METAITCAFMAPTASYREFMGSALDPKLRLLCGYQKKKGFSTILSGNIELKIYNSSMGKDYNITLMDHAYDNPQRNVSIKRGTTVPVVVKTDKSYNWYDFSVRVDGIEAFEQRFAGRVETGKPTNPIRTWEGSNRKP